MRKFLGILIVSLFVFVGCSTKQKVQEEIKNPTEQSISKSVASISSNYNIIETAPGITLYKHKSKNIYVQKIYTKEVDIRTMSIPVPNQPEQFYLCSINDYWTALKNKYPKLFSVTNISFFGQKTPQISTLPFGYKQEGNILTYGYGDSKFTTKRKILNINTNGAVTITGYSDDRFNSSQIKYSIVGLDVTADKGSLLTQGRTFMGVSFEEGNTKPMLIIAHGYSEHQSTMSSVLEEFGCYGDGAKIMFDGSGSSQLKTAKNVLYGRGKDGPDKRTIPTVLYTVPKN